MHQNDNLATALSRKSIAKKKHGLNSRLRLLLIATRSLIGRDNDKKDYAAFSASISGCYPSGGNVLLAACNDEYFHVFALDLISSMEILDETHALHLHLLEPSEATIEKATQLQQSLRNVKLTFTIDRCRLADALPYRQIYFTAARFLVAPLLLSHGADKLLIIDVDAVMNRSPWPLFNTAMANRTVGLIFRRDKKLPWQRVLASAVFFNSTNGSLRFAESLARALLAAFRRKPKYHIDQILPHYLCTIAARRYWDFSTFDMPAKVMGYLYEEDVAFWTVKGKRNLDTFFNERKALLERNVAAA